MISPKPIRIIHASLMAAGLCLLLSACTPTPPALPPAAEAALFDYWDSLPSSGEITNEIVRAWPGDMTGAETPPHMEAWCVEAEMSADDSEVDGQALIWIVMRTQEEAPWTAALLATLSSTWPYKACGEPHLP